MLHGASPLGTGDAGDPDALIVPARDGALRVLGAASAAGVERVVMTSSANAASPSSYTEDGVTDESLWTDLDDPTLPAYRRSRTVAEQAAWDSMAKSGSNGPTPTTLTTILPGAVFGPRLTVDTLGSVQVIRRLLRGDMPGTPRIGLEVVDVRDIADVHVRAMTAPEAAGKRFLATGEFLWMADIAGVLRAELGPDADRVPARKIPDLVVRATARFRPELRGIMPGLGRRNRHTTAKAQRVLGWAPRPAADAVVDCARRPARPVAARPRPPAGRPPGHLPPAPSPSPPRRSPPSTTSSPPATPHPPADAGPSSSGTSPRSSRSAGVRCRAGGCRRCCR